MGSYLKRPRVRKPTYMQTMLYIGDKKTKEFHSLKRQKPECNVKRITAANCIYFKRGSDAKAAKYDACAHCTRYWKSKR